MWGWNGRRKQSAFSRAVRGHGESQRSHESAGVEPAPGSRISEGQAGGTVGWVVKNYGEGMVTFNGGWDAMLSMVAGDEPTNAVAT